MTPGQQLAEIFLSGLPSGRSLVPTLASQIDMLVAGARNIALKEAAAICRRRAGPWGGVGLLMMLIEAAEEIEALVPGGGALIPGRPCARCGKPCDNLQGQYIVAGTSGDICHRCISPLDAVVAVAKGT